MAGTLSTALPLAEVLCVTVHSPHGVALCSWPLPAHLRIATCVAAHLSVRMGADCCGGAATSDPASIAAADAAQAQLADMHVNDAQPAADAGAAKPTANGAAPAKGPAKSDADIAKEKLPYFQKRIQLFEEYRKRELQKVDAAREANVQIKGSHAFLPPLPNCA